MMTVNTHGAEQVEIERLQARVEELDELRKHFEFKFTEQCQINLHLNAVLDKISKRIEKIAFDIPPPNQHTPNLIMLVNEIRHEYARNRGGSDER